jgi:hypothetical protein
MNYVNTGTVLSFFKSNTTRSRPRERTDMILEPLQGLTQLAFLSFCPIGSKLTIQNNILTIQLPVYSQGVLRWYQNDNKEDLFYLFNVFCRFVKNYKFLSEIQYKNTNLYNIIIQFAKEGISKLIETYTNCGNHTVIHTLQMYETMLKNPSVFDVEDIDRSSDDMNIDQIFSRISEIYTENDYYLLLHTLLILQNKHESYTSVINGSNKIMSSTYAQIKSWINDKMRI